MGRPQRPEGQGTMQPTEIEEIFTRCAPILNELNVSAGREFKRQKVEHTNRQISIKTMS